MSYGKQSRILGQLLKNAEGAVKAEQNLTKMVMSLAARLKCRKVSEKYVAVLLFCPSTQHPICPFFFAGRLAVVLLYYRFGMIIAGD